MALKFSSAIFLVAVCVSVTPGCGVAGEALWNIDNLENIGGHEVTVVGDPKVIETSHGRAVEFDGHDDALFLDVHPLEGMAEFTVEIVFRPDADGAAEQRFFHMQEEGSESRVMFETRLPAVGRWFLDTYIRSGEDSVTLYAEDDLHIMGDWYHAAVVVADGKFSHYVNGRLELEQAIRYVPQGPGRTSLGVRINEVHWFRGAIRTVRISPVALDPERFLMPAAD